MGKRNNTRKNAAMLDSDDTDSVSSSSTVTDSMVVSGIEDVQLNKESVLDQCLDALYEKRMPSMDPLSYFPKHKSWSKTSQKGNLSSQVKLRNIPYMGTTREKALATIIETFNCTLPHEFLNNKFVTLLDQCLNSIKRGSAKEVTLASHAIGLLALTIGPGEKAQEILEGSASPITEALRSRSETSKVSSLLDCLAVITFIGGVEPEETEKSMQIMWQVVHPKLGPNVVASKPSPTVITSMIAAWSFLLTTMDGWTLNSKAWQESISYLSTLLDKDDRSVRIAAGEALALIFEMGNLEKFSGLSKGSSDSSTLESGNSSREFSQIQGLKTKIIGQMRNLSAEAGGKGSAKKDLNNQRNLFRDILEFLEDGYSLETSVKIGGESLNTTTWSELIQLNFIKRFLGGGFVKHMQENEFLHDVFGFTPKKKHLLGGDVRLVSETEKRMYKSPNSIMNKARTQYLNKQRMLSQDRNAGLFGFD